MAHVLVEDERLVEGCGRDGSALRAEPARTGDGVEVERRDGCCDLDAGRSADLSPPC
jgi:hypothetical protein